jgi:enamine deaminase RidA (YjgF/YER057c/UK114 family)
MQAMSAEIKMFNPDTLGKPLGQYSHIARVKGAGELVFIAGQIATDKAGNLVGADDFDAQCAQVYRNIETALKAVGGGWSNVVQFTTYLVHSQDIPKLRAFRQREFSRYFPDGAYPPNTLVIIDRLVNESYLLEVQTVAAL